MSRPCYLHPTKEGSNCFLFFVPLMQFFLSGSVRADNDLNAKLSALISGHQGQVAVAVKNLATGASFTYRENEPMSTGGLIKISVMVEAYRQAHARQLELHELLTLDDEDFSFLTRAVVSRMARGRVVSTLEGGYNLSVIGPAAVAHVAML